MATVTKAPAATRTIAVYDKPDACQTLTENDTLRTERLLPDFSFSVRELFASCSRNSIDTANCTAL